ncbi:MAG: hypothetical protein GXP25_05655 [Planctomycetes bacterium]|nr:hypothetical protein [Planctomycetota bacterium]
MPQLTAKQKLTHAWGKARRFYYGVFNQDYITRSHARRRGECLRCGACCKLMIECGHLDEINGVPACAKHKVKYKNCRIFPIDEADLADRDIIAPGTKCGYYFLPK